ncbi:MAG: hypothetical protein OXN89_25065 [Bryobacterales bacterium]|nr:hypothetical protein [Bryobacterales bacterium]
MLLRRLQDQVQARWESLLESLAEHPLLGAQLAALQQEYNELNRRVSSSDKLSETRAEMLSGCRVQSAPGAGSAITVLAADGAASVGYRLPGVLGPSAPAHRKVVRPLWAVSTNRQWARGVVTASWRRNFEEWTGARPLGGRAWR